MKTLENLKYPIGKFEIPASFNKESIEQWISIIREFPQKIQNEITSLSEAELEQQYRPEGWAIRIDLKTNLAIYAWHCNHHLAHIKQAKKS
ncbi:hypothetical protein ACTS9T_14100 [Empedobacter falsenii]|uniref:hypothetical protein n=1 Tax=Empedobacter TaxID=59734 RepID=UPI002447E6C3|nr:MULTISPECIES: hypothetical protein [Empedobacter]MDH1881422.1 hypothetical protein [Empedobacter sp. GD03797]MDM1040340.1 hypothetical protein [Empedobacter brevis]MDM1134272.1 hypothetical protein [Empedobacter sp. R750]